MTTVKTEGKTGFLKEFFVDHPDAGKAAVDKAWKDAGNGGTISTSLISKVRSELGLTGNRRTTAKAKPSVGAGKRSSAAPQFQARMAGPKAGGLTAPVVKAKGKNATAVAVPPAGPRPIGGVRTQSLIELEGRIDDLLHEARATGGMSEFEEALRRARRILVRSHGG
jgi:hypothetical protein